MRRTWHGAIVAAAIAMCPFAATADAVADFYKGKTITLFIGYSPGGGYDTYARAVGRTLGSHIPGNPDVVAKNRPGAGGSGQGLARRLRGDHEGPWLHKRRQDAKS